MSKKSAPKTTAKPKVKAPVRTNGKSKASASLNADSTGPVTATVTFTDKDFDDLKDYVTALQARIYRLERRRWFW